MSPAIFSTSALRGMVIFGLLSSLYPVRPASAQTWDGECGSNWYDCCNYGTEQDPDWRNNWTIPPSQAGCPPWPGPNDDINASGTIIHSLGDTTVKSLAISGTFTMTGGQVAANEDLSIVGNFFSPTTVLLKDGAYRLVLGGATSNAWISSSSTLEFQNDAHLWGVEGSAVLLNEGVIWKTGTVPVPPGSPPNASALDIALDNQGTITAWDGIIAITRGGTSTGIIEALGTGVIRFGANVMTLDGEVRGNGLVQFAGGITNVVGNYHPTNTLVNGGYGTVNFQVDTSIENLTLDNASKVGGSGDLTVDNLVWHGTPADMLAGGTTIVQETALFQGLSNNQASDLYRDLELRGDSILDSNSQIRMESAELRNYGDFELRSNTNISQFSPTAGFRNLGILRKTNGGTSVISVLTSNVGGTIDVQSGELAFHEEMATTGPINLSPGTLLRLGQGQQSLFPAGSITGPGTVLFAPIYYQGITDRMEGTYDVGTTSLQGGTVEFAAAGSTDTFNMQGGNLIGAANLLVNQQFNWSGGGMEGTGLVNVVGTTSVSGNPYCNRLVELHGNSTFNEGAALHLSASDLRNFATMELKSDSNLDQDCCVTSGRLLSTGVIRKTGPGSARIGVRTDSMPGSIAVEEGALRLDVNMIKNGPITLNPGTTLAYGGGQHQLNAPGGITGPGRVHFEWTFNRETIAGAYAVATTQIDGGAVEFNANGSTDQLTLNGGALTGSAVFSIANQFNLNGGSMDGTGKTNVLGTTQVNNQSFCNRLLELHGNSTFNPGATLQMQESELRNFATMELKDDSNLNQWCCTTNARLINTGTIRKVGPGSARIAVATDTMPGAIQVPEGTLRLDANMIKNGPITVDSGATLFYAGGQHQLNSPGSITGDGTVFLEWTFNKEVISGNYAVGNTQINGGTIEFNASGSSNQLTLNGGALKGSADFTVNNQFNLNGGSMDGTGKTNVLGTTQTSGTSYCNRLLELHGDSTFNPGTNLNMVEAELRNFATLEMMDDSAINQACCTTNARVANTGIIRKSGTGSAQIGVAADSMSGAIQVPEGVLRLNANMIKNGPITVDAGATLFYAGGQHQLQTPGSITGSGSVLFEWTFNREVISGVYSVGATQINGGTVEFNTNGSTDDLTMNGGTLTGTADLVINDQFNWNGGQMQGAGRTIAMGDTIVNGPPGCARTIELRGATSFIGDGNISCNGALIRNYGAITFDSPFSHPLSGNPQNAGNSLQNNGTFRKTGGAAISRIVPPVVNSGLVFAQSGDLRFIANTGAPPYIQTGGELRLAGGNVSAYANDCCATSMAFNGGKLTGAGTVSVNSLVMNAEIHPGSSAGTITAEGSYTQQSGGSLNIELGGLAPGSGHDQLIVTGAANLDGALNVSVLPGYMPAVDDEYVILTCAARTGQFAVVNADPGMTFNVEYTPTSVILRVTAACFACDANCDSFIDGRDVGFLVAAILGAPPTGCSPCAGDVNFDSQVDMGDIEGFISCLLNN